MEEVFKDYVDTDVKITEEVLESVTKQKEIINNQFGKLAADAMFGKDEKPELGMKHDQEKPMMNLIPPSVFESLGKVLTYGANKYAPNSWQHVTNAEERYKAALLRHFVEYMKNPLSKDEESGMYHIEHVLCNAAFLNDFTIRNPDDRKYITKHIHQPELDKLEKNKCMDCGVEFNDSEKHSCKIHNYEYPIVNDEYNQSSQHMVNLVNYGFYYMARDKDGHLWAFKKKPVKNIEIGSWDVEEKDDYHFEAKISYLNTLYQEIKWEDDEAVDINTHHWALYGPDIVDFEEWCKLVGITFDIERSK